MENQEGVSMQSKIMLAKETYDKSEKQIMQLEREWYGRRYLVNSSNYYELNVMAILIYLLKQYNGSFIELNDFFHSNKIDNHHFQKIMKKYLFQDYVQEFLLKNTDLDDFLLLGIGLFYNEYKMNRDNSVEGNKSLNLTLQYLLKIEELNSFSLMQVGLNDGTILLDMVMKYHLISYLAFNRDDRLMVLLQLRSLLLDMLDIQLIEADIYNGEFALRNKSFDRILCVPLWNYRFDKRLILNPRVKNRLDSICTQPVYSDWLEVMAAFEQLSDDGVMVALMTNSSLTNSQNQAIRRYLVECGYIQSVIELPDLLLEFKRFPLYAVVLSHNNKHIQFIDASKAYTQERRYKNIDLEYFKKIMEGFDNNCYSAELMRVKAEEFNLLPKRYTIDPIHYDGISLGEICNISRGPVIPSKELDEITTLDDTGIRYVYSQALDTQQVDMSQLPFVDKSKLGKSSQVIEENSLVLTRTSPFKSNMLHLQPGAGVIINGNLFSITIAPKYRNLYLLDYIAAFFNSTLGREQIERLASGSVIKSISIKDLKSLAIPKVSIDQQRRFLGHADKIIQMRTDLLKKLDEVNQEFNKLVEEEFNW